MYLRFILAMKAVFVISVEAETQKTVISNSVQQSKTPSSTPGKSVCLVVFIC